MFLIESNNNFSFSWYDKQYSSNLPASLNYSESTLPCHKIISTYTYEKGMHLLTQYIEILRRISGIADQTISTSNIKNKIFSNITDYMTLSIGIQKVLDYLKTMNRYKYLEYSKDVAYFCEIPMLKRMMHRNGPVVVELFCCDDVLNRSRIDKFIVDSNGEISSYKYSKGFIAVGYNSTGMILQNSVGQGYGNAGFVQINYDLFKKLFIKGCCIQNII